jgi:serine phosphatase RsbU (regulator of sigma subunit)
MFFGGINGLVRFDPAMMKDNPHPPAVVLTAFNILNREIPLNQPIEQLKEIKLSYRDIVFSFEYTALDYTNPAKNQYAYKLEGFDQDWIEAGTRRFGTYTNLDAGTYTLRIKGSNNSGVWNEDGVALKIVVTPPFWETWWFRLIASAAVLALGFTAYTIRVANIQAQREKLKVLVAERTAELSQANEHLRTLTDRLQQELTTAHEIQRSLLPPPRPNWPSLDVVCYSTSAREVGGDFYAYHAFDPPLSLSPLRGEIEGGKCAIALGDVSGKGMPAALLMAVSLASFQSVIGQALTPAELLAQLDAALVPYTRTRFLQNCALCYVEITRTPAGDQSGFLRAANAGCVAPLVRRANGALEWVDIGGPPLGIGLSDSTSYIETTLVLQPGDLVILTSDGVIEAMNAAREIFGFERLERVIAAGPQTSAEAMLAHLRTAVLAFTAGTELHDDLTIVVVQV